MVAIMTAHDFNRGAIGNRQLWKPFQWFFVRANRFNGFQNAGNPDCSIFSLPVRIKFT